MKADNVLTACHSRAVVALHRLAEVEAAEGLAGSQTLNHARAILRDLVKLVEDYWTTTAPLPTRSGATHVESRKGEQTPWDEYVRYCAENGIVPAERPDQTTLF
jgi:hypothetical protein